GNCGMQTSRTARGLAALCCATLIAVTAAAQEPSVESQPTEEAQPEDPQTLRAREEFLRGSELVQKAQWAEALGAFERSAKLRPHAITRFNIGACQRALGRYTRARASLLQALEQNDKQGGAQLSDTLISDSRAFLKEIEGVLARVRIRLEPRRARIAINGRPLARASGNTMVADMREPGQGEPPPASRFDVLLDPGAHVITLAHKGFRNIVIRRTFDPGSTTDLPLTMNKLRAVLHVEATRKDAVVRVNDKDVGVAPVDVERPAGSYRVIVEKDGYVSYDTQVTVEPGQRANLRAPLPVEEPGIYQRWWLWTTAGVVVNAAVTITFLLTRPAPQREEPNGGGLGWVIDTR
ncbi:MAG TPA: PEGA domain-containing protein, partial [Polyangiaceae bacterium]|nr:PEGA domain-containing protein [Polyangiaceae bacterium]